MFLPVFLLMYESRKNKGLQNKIKKIKEKKDEKLKKYSNGNRLSSSSNGWNSFCKHRNYNSKCATTKTMHGQRHERNHKYCGKLY